MTRGVSSLFGFFWVQSVNELFGDAVVVDEEIADESHLVALDQHRLTLFGRRVCDGRTGRDAHLAPVR